MSLASLQLNPAIAKPTSNGQVQCIVCNVQVKPKIWTAHVNGKKHKESCEKLKQQLATSAKRAIEKSPMENGAPPKKKMKDSSAPTSTGPLPPDFFDDEPTLNIQTPWQKAKEDEAALLRERKGIIEGVPQGFFDDKKKDGMVRETIVNEAHMNEEYERLMRELTEKNVEDEAKAEEEEERDALLRDLDNADEQMEKWMRLNAMEKLKEARLQEAREKTTIGDDDDEGSDDDDADFTNWRAKRVL
ncbi:hypothetical protein V3C99_001612 [Haemonchus contortus]|nr:similar to AGAP004605-PA [Haemonchus contortus]